MIWLLNLWNRAMNLFNIIQQSSLTVKKSDSLGVFYFRSKKRIQTDAYRQTGFIKKIVATYLSKIMAKQFSEHKLLFYKNINKLHYDFGVHPGVLPFAKYKFIVQKQRAVVQNKPRSKSTEAFKNIDSRVDNGSVPVYITGCLNIFVERLIHTH